jgi:hypothetical protein
VYVHLKWGLRKDIRTQCALVVTSGQDAVSSGVGVFFVVAQTRKIAEFA